MGLRAGFTVLVVAGLASTSARPCDAELTAVDAVFLPQDGEIPTNHAMFAREFAFDRTVQVTPDGGVEETRVLDEAGRISLEPNTAYTIRHDEQSAHVLTTSGPDDSAPTAPTLTTHVEHVDGAGLHFRICDSLIPIYDDGGDVVFATVDLEGEAVAALVVNEDDIVVSASTDGVVSLGVTGIARVAVIDAAGNRSEAVDVDVDAVLAEGSGCAQTSPSMWAATAFVLVPLIARRRSR